MTNNYFTTSFVVVQSQRQVFDAINNVKGWWNANAEGRSEQLNDAFTVQFADIHYSKQEVTELLPDEKITWLVTDSKLNFLLDKTEWTGTSIVFEISKKQDKTHVQFTHRGLAPGIECFDACSNAWTDFIQNSLFKFITAGEGKPFKG